MAGPVLNKGVKHYYAPVIFTVPNVPDDPTIGDLVQIKNVRNCSGIDQKRNRVDITDIDEPSGSEQSLPGFIANTEISITVGRHVATTVMDAIAALLRRERP
jgi:hypothetical protein